MSNGNRAITGAKALFDLIDVTTGVKNDGFSIEKASVITSDYVINPGDTIIIVNNSGINITYDVVNEGNPGRKLLVLNPGGVDFTFNGGNVTDGKSLYLIHDASGTSPLGLWGVLFGGTGGGGASDFISLTDTPASYSGKGGDAVIVNKAESGIDFSLRPWEVNGDGRIQATEDTIHGGGAWPLLSEFGDTSGDVHVSDVNSIVLSTGENSNIWDGNTGVIIGKNNVLANNPGINAVAIGEGMCMEANNSVGIGVGNEVTDGAVAIGEGNSANSEGAVCIGQQCNSRVNSTNSVVIGKEIELAQCEGGIGIGSKIISNGGTSNILISSDDNNTTTVNSGNNILIETYQNSIGNTGGNVVIGDFNSIADTSGSNVILGGHSTLHTNTNGNVVLGGGHKIDGWVNLVAGGSNTLDIGHNSNNLVVGSYNVLDSCQFGIVAGDRLDNIRSAGVHVGWRHDASGFHILETETSVAIGSAGTLAHLGNPSNTYIYVPDNTIISFDIHLTVRDVGSTAAGIVKFTAVCSANDSGNITTNNGSIYATAGDSNLYNNIAAYIEAGTNYEVRLHVENNTSVETYFKAKIDYNMLHTTSIT